MKIRGKWFKKEIFFSFCSIHYIPEKSCKICNTGIWENYYTWKIKSFMHKYFYKLWFWYVNKF